MLYTWMLRFYVFCLLGIFVFTQNVTRKCEKNISETIDGIEFWQYNGIAYKISEECLCPKTNNTIVIPGCDTNTGSWLPDLIQSKMQTQPNKYCPEDLYEIPLLQSDFLCLKISTELEPFNENFCYGSDIILPLDLIESENVEVTNFLLKKNITDYWLPIKRNNNDMPFEVRLPGKQWKKDVSDNLINDVNKPNENCLKHVIYSQNNSLIQTENCNALLNAVCVFKSEFISSFACPDGYGASSYRPNECYGINWNTNTNESVHIREYLINRNLIKNILLKLTVQERNNITFKVDYFVDHFGDKYIIIMDTHGIVKIINEEYQFYPALSKKITSKSIKMIFKEERHLNKIKLVIYNRKYLWINDDKDVGIKCYTYTKKGLLKNAHVHLKWENKEHTHSIYLVTLVAKYPTEYWCEGHSIFGFELVATQGFVASKKSNGYDFVIRWNRLCNPQDNATTNLCYHSDTSSKDIVNKVRDILKSKIYSPKFNDIMVKNIQIMSITKLLWAYWIYISVSLKTASEDNSAWKISDKNTLIHGDFKDTKNYIITMRLQSMLTEIVTDLSNSTALVRSAEYCFPQKFYFQNKIKTHWMEALVGEKGTTRKLCLQENGLPYTRLCKGDYVHGAYWVKISLPLFCNPAQNNTKFLYDLENNSLIQSAPETIINTVKNFIKQSKKDLVAADVYIISNIMRDAFRSIKRRNIISCDSTFQMTVATTNVWKTSLYDFVDIFDSLLDVEPSVIRIPALLYSTNKLLNTFENSIDAHLPLPSHPEIFVEDDSILDYDDIGVSVKISNNVLYFLINPIIANVSGIALFKNNGSENIDEKLKGSFINEHYRFLQTNFDILELVDELNLQLAVIIPMELLSHLRKLYYICGNSKISNSFVVIKIFSNNALFQPTASSKTLTSHIASVSLPGYSLHLPVPIPLVLRTSPDQLNNSGSCYYWNNGVWVNDGITMSTPTHSQKNDVVLCHLNHLKPIAYLVGHTIESEIDTPFNNKTLHIDDFNNKTLHIDDFNNKTLPIDDFNKKILHTNNINIIPVIGCSLSILGVGSIFFMALKCNFGQRLSLNSLLHLNVAIALQMIIFLFANIDIFPPIIFLNKGLSRCAFLAACLHYSVLVELCWILIVAHLSNKRRPNKLFIIKSTVFCWIVPLISFVYIILLDNGSFSKGVICYPSGLALYLSIIAPIAVLFIINCILICFISYKRLSELSKTSQIPGFGLGLLLTICILLGLTWIFGILATLKLDNIFSYLFCITAAIQSLTIYLYFIIIDSHSNGD